ncbi:MAG: Bifunctional protein GlmU [Methanoregulaceae archaeon PtaB.Bin009]|jgi:bifunctional UDP-N-acetylglucosamine pyrophosphorylase/glucosamine-1-phosphate N-acetyltransferase|nr:MAG: Bifunctional protein GlmU [Methanoregulaceae archaeon PtaB.Bin009]OPY41412.1 MAG: Bifunctional protein GlmU [Methanoregulaceae archaeon PtaU1.Bin066]HNQ30557.1 sugar phosphate nucleotidyltransferase [Methanolinea sp.]
MQCVILAAGEGKRMRPLTATRPKVMLPLANRPMLEHLVLAVCDAGISDLLIVTGYMEAEIRKHFGNGRTLGVGIEYAVQRHQRGTADALLQAREWLEGDFIVMNGDMVVPSADIARVLAADPHCMAVASSDHPEDYGVVQIEGEIITGLQEKAQSPQGNMVNAGLYHFSQDIFPLLDRVGLSPRGERELTDALAMLIRKGELAACRLTSWIDVGYPWDLLSANERMMQEMTASIQGVIEEGVVLKGAVSVGEGSVIRSGTCIEGPCSIGRDCRIGPHAYIRGATTIGDGCHIGHATEVKNSIVLPNTNLPHFNYLGDSVVGSGCNFGAGTKVANLRHDRAEVKVRGISTKRRKLGAIVGDRVQTGINCSVNVGAVIGCGAQIGPHALVDGYIAPGAKIR